MRWMTLVVRNLLLLSALVVLSACTPSIEEITGPTMGSTYSIKYVPSAATPSRQAVQVAVNQILVQVDEAFSTYRPDSLVARFNALPAHSCMPMPSFVLEVLTFALELSAQSNGAFDVTIKPLGDLWGFGADAVHHVPNYQDVLAAQQKVGYQHLHIDGARLCKEAPVALDPNSIVAGYAVDTVAQRLQSLGIHSYLIDITGELGAHGRKPDGSAWRIAIETPQLGPQVPARLLPLDNIGVSTSGDYRNFFEEGGQRFSHTLDPRTGAPITHALASVTVLDASVLHADGLSTLLMVLGPEAGYEFARAHNIAAFFIIYAAERFTTKMTPEFQELALKEATP